MRKAEIWWRYSELSRIPMILGIPSAVHRSLPLQATADDERRFAETWLTAIADSADYDFRREPLNPADVAPIESRDLPLLVARTSEGETQFLALVKRSGRRLGLASKEGTVRHVDIDELADILCPAHVCGDAAERLASRVKLNKSARKRLLGVLADQRAPSTLQCETWRFIPRPSMRHVRSWVGAMFAMQAAAIVCFLSSWWLLGDMMATGRIDSGRITAWLLLLAANIPFRIYGEYIQGSLGLRIATFIKRQAFRGMLRLDPSKVKKRGHGELLGDVLETETLESASLDGAFSAISGGWELLAAMTVMMITSSLLSAAALAAMTTTQAVLAIRYWKARRDWTARRLLMTGDLAEKLVGFRTRRLQEARHAWSVGEDRCLEGYLRQSRRLDQLDVLIKHALPRGYLVIGMICLLPDMVTGTASGMLMAAVGTVLLAQQGLRKCGDSIEELCAAHIAWQAIKPCLSAASRSPAPVDPEIAASINLPMSKRDARVLDGRALMQLQGIHFQYADRKEPVLSGLSLAIQRGDHILLEGPSGCGKSTLAAVAAGNLTPTAGSLFLRGFDPHTIGDAVWGRRIVAAPQFHDNHVFVGSLAYNALVGRGWPACPGDLDEAERVMRGLGLGKLIDSMPAGIFQMVGDMGWQLSHGERSRLFAARALLQRPDLLVLDESFGALDPETLRDTMKFVSQEAESLVVVAHP